MAGAAGGAGVRAGRAFIIIEAVDRTAAVLNGVMARMRNFSQRMMAMGREAATAAAVGLLPVGLGVKEFANFDDQMRRLETRSEGTSEELKNLREKAIELGRAGAYSAAEIAQLMTVIGAAGTKRSGIIAMTQDIINLTRASGEGKENELVMGAELLMGTLNQFGLKAAESERVADLLTKTVNGTMTNFEGLADAMKYIGPLAHDMDLSLEDVLATIGQLSQIKIMGTMAGTAVRGIIAEITDSEKRNKFNEMLKETTGSMIEFGDAAGNMRKPADILFAVGEATKNIGNLKRMEIFAQLLEMRQLTAGSGLSQGKNPFSDLRTELSVTNHDAAKKAALLDAGIGGAIRRLLGSLKTLDMALGKSLDKTIQALTPYVVELGLVLEYLIDQFPKTTVAIIAMTAALGIMGLTLIGLSLVIAAISSPLAWLVPLGFLVSAAVYGIGVALLKWWGILDAVTAAIAQNKIGLAFEMIIVKMGIQWMKAIALLEKGYNRMLRAILGGYASITEWIPGMGKITEAFKWGSKEFGAKAEQDSEDAIKFAEMVLEAMKESVLHPKETPKDEDKKGKKYVPANLIVPATNLTGAGMQPIKALHALQRDAIGSADAAAEGGQSPVSKLVMESVKQTDLLREIAKNKKAAVEVEVVE